MATGSKTARKGKSGKGKSAALPLAARRPDAILFEDLPLERLGAMAEAGARVRDCFRVLAKTKDNVVGEILRSQGTFYEWDHYPSGDVYDGETHAQYYYHAHPAELRSGEHGHFHTFLRPKGIPRRIQPAPVPDYVPPADKDDKLSHLIGISMDRAGIPIRLFTTNRWVTGEVWYKAEDVVTLLDRFDIDLAWPAWPTNIWLTNMVRLFHPQIAGLLQLRDRTVEAWQESHPDGNVYEDRDLEITSVMDIDVERQIRAVERALAARRG